MFRKYNHWRVRYAQFDLKNAKIRIRDGAGESVLVKVGEGNITWTERKNIEYTLDAGKLDEVREGDEAPVEVSMDFVWQFLKTSNGTSGDGTGVKNILEGTGYTSTDPDTCRPYACDIEIHYTPECEGSNETITLPDFRAEEFSHDASAGQISVSGRCNVTKATVL